MTTKGLAALESFCEGLKGVNDQQRRTIAAVVAERDGLKAELKERWNLDAKLEAMEKDRDEWKGMASRGATTNVEYMALMEAAQDRAERAEKERDVETAVGFALGGQLNDAEATLARLLQTMVDLVDSAHEDGVMIHVPDRVRVALATPLGDAGLRKVAQRVLDAIDRAEAEDDDLPDGIDGELIDDLRDALTTLGKDTP